MSGCSPMHDLQSNTEDIEFDEADESTYANNQLYEKVYETAEKFASTCVGQYTTGKVDRFLKLIEDTAKWSLPSNSQERTNPGMLLERPLPWIPFIALILVLRLIRMSLSICGLFIGNSPLLPKDVVYFIQTRRRKLRAIRIAGMREIKRKEEEAIHDQGNGIFSRITSLLALVICRPRQNQETHNAIVVNHDSLEEATNNADVLNVVPSKHTRAREDNFSDEELTIDQIIDKYGEVGSEDEDDSDFIPPNTLNDEDTSSESTSTATSDDGDSNDEDNYATNEVLPTRLNTKSGSNVNMTNGYSTTENQDHDLSVEIKENGKQPDKGFRKQKEVPRPMKEEPMPLPIGDIKQEPADDFDEITHNHQHYQETPTEPGSLNDHNQQQKAVVELNDGLKCKDTADNLNQKLHSQLNGVEGSSKSEVFLTPATSAEDLFFSPVGSPDLYDSAYGFRPTSILKNCQAVNMENRRDQSAIGETKTFLKAESTSETYSGPSVPVYSSNQLPRGSINNSGRPSKNKFRGRRR